MNTYAKYCPNVFVAKCEEPHEKGEIISVTTKYGKENEHLVWNLVAQRNGYWYYSITRADGYDHQERAKAKAERYAASSERASQKSSDYFEKSEQAVAGIVPGQPILVDHYSGKYHKQALDRSWSAMEKSVEMSEKAKDYQYKAEYWEKKSQEINLSMPESLDFYAEQLKVLEEIHAKYKSGELPREHAYSLTHAKKNVNECRDKLEKAKKLWGDNEQ